MITSLAKCRMAEQDRKSHVESVLFIAPPTIHHAWVAAAHAGGEETAAEGNRPQVRPRASASRLTVVFESPTGTVTDIEDWNMAPQQIDRVLFQAQARPTGTLQLVQFKNGRVAIYRDEAQLAGCSWPIHQLYKGIHAFRDIASGKIPTPAAVVVAAAPAAPAVAAA
jgi:hypothetical protein